MTWPARAARNAVEILADYTPHVLTECAGATHAGAHDVRHSVRLAGQAPVIDIVFRLGGPGGPICVRTDEPVDEIGRTCGLRALGVSLEEDLVSLPRWRGPHAGPVLRL